MRYVYDHLLSRELLHKGDEPLNFLGITAIDDPTFGGASHIYELRTGSRLDPQFVTYIQFQTGTIAENGINGVTNEALLAIVIDRLRSFQNGEFKCTENASALNYAEHAMHWLKQRTRRRLEQGIEGTHVEHTTDEENRRANLAAAEKEALKPATILYNEEQKAIKDAQERERLIAESREDELPENQKKVEGDVGGQV